MNILLPSNENKNDYLPTSEKDSFSYPLFRITIQMNNLNFFVNFRRTWSAPLLVFGIVTSTIAALPLLEEPGRIRPQLLHRSDPLFEDWEKWKISKSISINWKITYDVLRIAKKWIKNRKDFHQKKHRGRFIFILFVIPDFEIPSSQKIRYILLLSGL